MDTNQSKIQNSPTISSLVIPLDLGYKINSKNGNTTYLLGISAMHNINISTGSSAKVIHEDMAGDKLSVINQIDESPYSF